MRINLLGKTKSLTKFTDEELANDLRVICEELSKREFWNSSWLILNNIGLPTPCQQEQLLLDQLLKELESKKKELSTIADEVENAKNKRKLVTQDILEEEKKLAELKDSPGNFSSKDIYQIQESLQNSINLIQSTLVDKIDNENRELMRVLEKTEDKLMLREADVQRFQEDLFRKSTTPYLKQFIALADMMRKLVIETTEDSENSDYMYLRDQITKLVESINYILRDFSVEVYQRDFEEEIFNPQLQEVIAYYPTNNTELDKKVKRTINPGYIWTLPYILRAKANGEQLPLKEYRAIFRREQVECYKLNQ